MANQGTCDFIRPPLMLGYLLCVMCRRGGCRQNLGGTCKPHSSCFSGWTLGICTKSPGRLLCPQLPSWLCPLPRSWSTISMMMAWCVSTLLPLLAPQRYPIKVAVLAPLCALVMLDAPRPSIVTSSHAAMCWKCGSLQHFIASCYSLNRCLLNWYLAK